MTAADDSFRRDVDRIAAIPEVPLILDVCAKATGMGFVAVARVTEDRWITCASRDEFAFGLRSGDELEVHATICREVHAERCLIVIEDVEASDAWRDHPTPLRYGFRSYISVPILLTDGSFFGTLCAIHPSPSRLGADVVAMFGLCARLIAIGLDGQDELDGQRASLASERDEAMLREHFVAVLGHDLRNPLAAIVAGLNMIERDPAGERAAAVIPMMRLSVGRMTELIGNTLDFARTRMGGGIALSTDAGTPLAPVLEQVVAEVRAAHPGRRIEARLSLGAPVRCDADRIGQMLSNLLSNAVTHGEADAPIRVDASTGASTEGGTFTLSVANAGAPIPEVLRERLFQPFAPGADPRRQGLGLGLYICAEIARAHGGTLDVISTAEETRFTFAMPIKG